MGNSEKTLFFLDNNEITESDYELYNQSKSEKFVIITTSKTEEFGVKEVIYAYSSEVGYIEYGEKNNIHLKEQLAFEKHMIEYAEKSGAIAEYEKTGVVSEAYLDYEKKYYEKVSGKSTKAYLFMLNREHNMGGGNFPMGETFAVMPPTWNNEVSCIKNIGLLGVVTIFDKWFYRDRIATMQFIEFQQRDLYYGANNTTSSIIKAW